MSRTEQAAKEIGKHFICLTGSGKAANFQKRSQPFNAALQTETDRGANREELTKTLTPKENKYHIMKESRQGGTNIQFPPYFH